MLRRFLPLFLFGALLLSACDDPSNVGLGLVGGEGGEPVLFRTPAAPFTLAENQREIGGSTALVLAGRVSDPLLGDIEATGYIDFGDPRAFGQGNLARFRSGTVREAYLQMPRRYLYGDTLSAVAYTLRSLAEEFNQIGLPTDADPDTTFSFGAVVTTFTYSLPDSLVKIPLPTAWVTANDTTLRSSVFPASFNGFEIKATGGNAVIGFAPGIVQLFAATSQDTVRYDGNKAATLTRRLSQPVLPDGYVLIQDGFPSAYRITFDSTPLAEAKDDNLSRLALEFQTDPTLIAQTPANFVRPLLSTVELIGANSSGGIIIASVSGTVCENAFFCATARPPSSGRTVIANSQFTSIGRRLLQSQPDTIKAAYLRPPLELGTINPLVIRGPGTPEAPMLVFTLVPTE